MTRTHLHYTIRLKLLPSGQFAEAQVTLRIPAPPKADRLSFYLHRQFGITRISGKEISGYAFNRAPARPPSHSPEAGLLEVILEKTFQGAEMLDITFDYAGWITAWPPSSPNQITSQWVEMGIYLPWFPYNPSYGKFSFQLEVDCEPEYSLLSFGVPERNGDIWKFQSPGTVTDIVVIAGKEIKTYQSSQGNCRTGLYYHDLSENHVAEIIADLKWIMNQFFRWFGPCENNALNLVQSARTLGGGYTRPGLIVLANLKDEEYAEKREDYFRYFGHEISHLWWNRADPANWNDWLNESFAEFSALLLVREKYGEAAFERRMAKKLEQSSGAPPIWGLERGNNIDNPSAAQTLYQKGPLLLYELTERIGLERFFVLCRLLNQREIRTTAAFLDLLDNQEGEQTRFWMEKRLKKE